MSCLQADQCDDLEAAVSSLSKLEFQQAKHQIQIIWMMTIFMMMAKVTLLRPSYDYSSILRMANLIYH